MRINKKELFIGMEVYVAFIVFDKNNRYRHYDIEECHIEKIGRKKLTTDYTQCGAREFLIDHESCDRFEFAIPATNYAPSFPTVLCLTESDAEKHIRKHELMKELSKYRISERTCSLEQLLTIEKVLEKNFDITQEE